MNLNKFKKTEIIPISFLTTVDTEIEINSKRKIGKFTDRWKSNSALLNYQWVKEKIKDK